MKKVGTETVEGVKTTHYTGTVSLDRPPEGRQGRGEGHPRAAREEPQQYEKMGLDKFTMDMWVDGEDHTKQFRMRGRPTRVRST